MDRNYTLATDLYQLTMAYGYWKSGMAEREAVFHLFFRRNPFGSGYSVAAGLGPAIEYLRAFQFVDEDLAYLSSLEGSDGEPLFEHAFLDQLRSIRFTCDVDAITEGSVVFAQEPLLRIQGPLLQCQLVETALLTILNFQTLIATKAARICLAARGAPVLEFGLRRAQGFDGALSATRAAWIGGVEATSNVMAAKELGIPPRGTHAHSWVMTFDTELEAFERYAEAMPNNVLLLVDTYDTLDGVRNAVRVGQRLRERGYSLAGIRLDSGDLAWLSIEARKILDAGGLTDAKIVATNDLDETIIVSLIDQGAKIDVWGVGTKLITAYDQPALGGVYKLGAVRDASGEWERRVKVSEQPAKTTTPGILQVRRFEIGGEYRGDMLYDTLDGEPAADALMVDPADATKRRRWSDAQESKDLLLPIFRSGELVYEVPPIDRSRAFAAEEMSKLHPTVRRLLNPHVYPVGLEATLHERRVTMVEAARGKAPGPGA